MTDKVNLIIDGKEVSVEQGKTLLDAARENGKDIPTIYYHEATTANAKEITRKKSSIKNGKTKTTKKTTAKKVRK